MTQSVDEQIEAQKPPPLKIDKSIKLVCGHCYIGHVPTGNYKIVKPERCECDKCDWHKGAGMQSTLF